jgi:hypothetical protein
MTRHGFTLSTIAVITRKIWESLDEYWDKSSDTLVETDLSLILVGHHTKRIGLRLCPREEIIYSELLNKQSYSVMHLQGVILRVLDAANKGSSEEEVARILGEVESDDEEKEVEVYKF